MISLQERLEIVRAVENGSLTRVMDDPKLYAYWNSLVDDNYNTLRPYNYENVAKHLDNLKLFSMGKLVTYFNDLVAESRGSGEDKILKMIGIDDKYNQVFQNTEMQTIKTSADTEQFIYDTADDDSMESFIYLTQLDNRVRPYHASLHGFTALKSDPVWANGLTPPLDYGCRCYLQETNAPVSSDEMRERFIDDMGIRDVMNKIDENNINEDFRFVNKPYIMPPNHTYFKSLKSGQYAKLFKQWARKRNLEI